MNIHRLGKEITTNYTFTSPQKVIIFKSIHWHTSIILHYTLLYMFGCILFTSSYGNNFVIFSMKRIKNKCIFPVVIFHKNNFINDSLEKFLSTLQLIGNIIKITELPNLGKFPSVFFHTQAL